MMLLYSKRKELADKIVKDLAASNYAIEPTNIITELHSKGLLNERKVAELLGMPVVMHKVILNKTYGGFSVSPKAYELYAKKKGIDCFFYDIDVTRFTDGKMHIVMTKRTADTVDSVLMHCLSKDYGDKLVDVDIDYDNDVINLTGSYRADPTLIEVVEELGEKANTMCSNLKIVEIPAYLVGNYVVDDYDGMETLHEKVDTY